jgi:hypothetical protein
MYISLNSNRRNLSKAHFSGRRSVPRPSHSLCNCLIIDPCGCAVDPCTCFMTDAAGCYQDCPCTIAHTPGLPKKDRARLVDKEAGK